MTFQAKLAAPIPTSQVYPDYLVSRILKDAVVLLCAPSGSIATGSLAAALTERGFDPIWCRLDPNDSDPGMLLGSLIAGLRVRSPEAGSATLERMREQPGPVHGWPPLFAHLAREIGDRDESDALVIENIQYLDGGREALSLLSTHFLPLLPERTHCLLTSTVSLPKKELPNRALIVGQQELRHNAHALQAAAGPLARPSLQRLMTLLQNQTAAIASALSAAAWLEVEALDEHIRRAGSGKSLLERIARDCLAAAQPAEIEALAAFMRLEYCHPDLVRQVLAGVQPADGPWWQELQDGWRRIRLFWHDPLRQALRSAATPSARVLERAAEYYTGQYAPERAVELYLELGKPSEAAQCMNAAAGAMVNLGQWQTLQGWLARLPAAVLNRWPRLVYAGVEMMVARGDVPSARAAFAAATRLFESQQDLVGVCQSLLAESALALKENDLETARERAGLALRRATQGEYPWFVVWAAWHLGCLALFDFDLELALGSFTQAREAAELLGDSTAIELTLQVETLVRQQRNLALERERHRRVYYQLEQSERETAERLRFTLMEVPDNMDALLRVHGWSSVPLSIKMQPALPHLPYEDAEKPSLNGFWGRLRFLLSRGEAEAQLPSPPPLPVTPPAPALRQAKTDALPGAPARLTSPEQRTRSSPKAEEGQAARAQEQLPAPKPAADPGPQPAEPDQTGLVWPTLTAHLLGMFHANLDDRPIEHLMRGQVLMLFQYLLIHRGRPAPREVLMETFWPDAAPEFGSQQPERCLTQPAPRGQRPKRGIAGAVPGWSLPVESSLPLLAGCGRVRAHGPGRSPRPPGRRPGRRGGRL